MSVRKKLWISFGLIIVLVIIASLVGYPKGPDIKLGNYFRELKVHLGLDLMGGTNLIYEADTSALTDQSEATNALEGVRDVIERRINAFGISEPEIQTNKTAGKWRVSVELPGITNINEAIKLIGETPLLEFREQIEPEAEPQETIDAYNAEQEKKARALLEQALAGKDFETLAQENSEDSTAPAGGDLGYFKKGDMVEEFNRVVFEKAGVGEVYPELVKTQFGYHVIKLEDRRTVTQESQANENQDTAGEEEVRARHILLKTKPFIEEQVAFNFNYVNTNLTGKQLKKAAVQFEQTTGEPQVLLQFNDEGKDLFAEITKKNVGKPVAIYLDQLPISVPTVQQEITSGEAVITGSFNLEEAKTLAKRLNSGALPIPITLVSQQNIGPTLGKLSITKSLFAGLFGLLIVALFMIIYYRLPGLVAVLTLLIYSLIILALFKLIPVTLTLAGVAGFILSIGMAVDANVLIFERMREELLAGKSAIMAISDGFSRAWLSIRDSNISSLITCVILAWMGSSLIKGFAITLGIGILVSMFSAITITRTFLLLLPRKLLQRSWLMGIILPEKNKEESNV